VLTRGQGGPLCQAVSGHASRCSHQQQRRPHDQAETLLALTFQVCVHGCVREKERVRLGFSIFSLFLGRHFYFILDTFRRRTIWMGRQSEMGFTRTFLRSPIAQRGLRVA